MSSLLRRTIHPEVRVINAGEGIVEYVASDESLDSYNERILAKGWRFTRFSKNAPFVDSHDYGCIEKLIGRVISFELRGTQLVEKVKWAIDTGSALAKLGFDLTVKGYLKAVSVGFMPTRMSWPGQKDWADAVKEAGLNADETAKTRAIYLEHEQIELSACIIGANPNALAKAFDARDISEEQLAGVGFAHDDLDFLLTTGRAWEDASIPMRAFIARELQRISRRTANTNSDSSASKPGGADESRHLENEENQKRCAEFLGQLRALSRR